jgi:hypothetical protein
MTINAFIEHLKHFRDSGEGETPIVVMSDVRGEYTYKGACILIQLKGGIQGKVLAIVSLAEGERLRDTAKQLPGCKVEDLDDGDGGKLH